MRFQSSTVVGTDPRLQRADLGSNGVEDAGQGAIPPAVFWRSHAGHGSGAKSLPEQVGRQSAGTSGVGAGRTRGLTRDSHPGQVRLDGGGVRTWASIDRRDDGRRRPYLAGDDVFHRAAHHPGGHAGRFKEITPAQQGALGPDVGLLGAISAGYLHTRNHGHAVLELAQEQRRQLPVVRHGPVRASRCWSPGVLLHAVAPEPHPEPSRQRGALGEGCSGTVQHRFQSRQSDQRDTAGRCATQNSPSLQHLETVLVDHLNLTPAGFTARCRGRNGIPHWRRLPLAVRGSGTRTPGTELRDRPPRAPLLPPRGAEPAAHRRSAQRTR